MLLFDQLKKGDPHLRAVAVGVAVGVAILLAGLWYVQVISADRYRADLQEQSMRIVRVPAIRGKILDRNGFALAENRPSYNVNLYLEEFRRQFRYEYTNRVLREYRQNHRNTRPTGKIDHELQSAARCRVVSNLLFQVSSLVQQPQAFDEKQFTNHYENLRSLPFPLLRDLSVQQVAYFTEHSSRLPDLSLEVQPVRRYPWTNTASHLVGHLTRDNRPPDEEEISFQFRLPDFVGATGVELAFDQHLRGRPGIKSVLVNNLQYRQSEEILTPPEPGDNVVLTLDLPIQRATESALRRAGPDPGAAAVVMDCRTGDVLAMASFPAFDPNAFMARISEEDWAKLSDEELRPQLNRAAYGTYAPGSTFKVIVSLASLEAGTLKPDELFEAKASYQINGRGHPWKCTAPPGLFDFDKAFYLSCNCYFIDHGLQTGFEKIAEMGRRFGLGTRTGLNTRLEAGGYFPDPAEKIKADGSRWMPGDTANLCIGQGELKVTPLQMAVMTAAIANGGKVLEPRVVDRIEPQDSSAGGAVIRFPTGQVRNELKLDPKHLELVRNGMLLDVTHRDPSGRLDGTGRRAAVEGIQVCGKTGTAQVMERGKLSAHVTWFVSFAPFDAPRYAVVVMVEVALSGSGALTCAPVAHEIYDAILKREQRVPLKPVPAVALN
jgi:penicillin-binding protein 2